MPRGKSSAFFTRTKSSRQPIIPIGPSIAYVPLTKGLFSLIDAEDADRVCAHNWKPYWNGSGYSVSRKFRVAKGRDVTQTLHRFVLGFEGKLQIDHRNMNGLDNRKSNLRRATSSLNCHNKKIRPDSTTGFKGVQRSGNRYRPILQVEGKRFYGASCATAEEAFVIYCAMAKEKVGEFFNPGY